MSAVASRCAVDSSDASGDCAWWKKGGRGAGWEAGSHAARWGWQCSQQTCCHQRRAQEGTPLTTQYPPGSSIAPGVYTKLTHLLRLLVSNECHHLPQQGIVGRGRPPQRRQAMLRKAQRARHVAAPAVEVTDSSSSSRTSFLSGGRAERTPAGQRATAVAPDSCPGAASRLT